MQEDELPTEDMGPTLEGAEGQQVEPPTQPRKEGRFGRVVRRGLQWAAAAGVLFLLGVLVVFFVRVRPQADQIKQLQRTLDETQSEVESLQSRMDQLEPLEDEIELLKAELSVKDRHLDLLAVLVDVTNAQLGLAKGEPATAAAALEATDDRLRSLQEGLDDREEEIVRGMRDRLGLVMQEIETDEFAAQNDLEILANNLVDLEDAVFGE